MTTISAFAASAGVSPGTVANALQKIRATPAAPPPTSVIDEQTEMPLLADQFAPADGPTVPGGPTVSAPTAPGVASPQPASAPTIAPQPAGPSLQIPSPASAPIAPAGPVINAPVMVAPVTANVSGTPSPINAPISAEALAGLPVVTPAGMSPDEQPPIPLKTYQVYAMGLQPLQVNAIDESEAIREYVTTLGVKETSKYQFRAVPVVAK